MICIATDLLDGATGVGASGTREVVGALTYFVQGKTTGTPTDASVVLQGSIDGISWQNIVSVDAAADVNGAWATGKPVKYIRFFLAGLSGGTNPTASASVLALG